MPTKKRGYKSGRSFMTHLETVAEELQSDSEKPEVIYVSSDEEVHAPPPKKMNGGTGIVESSPAVAGDVKSSPVVAGDVESSLAVAGSGRAQAKKSKKYDLVPDGTRWLREVAEALKKHVIVKDRGVSRDVLISFTKEQKVPEIVVEISRKFETETTKDSERSRVLVITVLDYTKDGKLSVLAHPGVVAANVMANIWPNDVQEGQEVIVPLVEVKREVRTGSVVQALIISVYFNMTPTTPQDEPIEIPKEVLMKATKAVFRQILDLL